ncbi:MAG: cation transporter [Gracilimonas sp.]|uniref:cation diffusion facilitator family transporter n=1 Tax=Gracilimonas sp. TaxID=1974203 RepID=UPI0019BBF046|nr:cation diffusion facilitator family transporter [Gracilimonas sp.]MBD3617677.1 cation transporter [Gracilimonas sp.]
MSNNEKHPAEKGFRTTFLGIAVSILLAAGKAVAGFLGNSFALIADAVESVGDIFTAIVMYLGLRKAAQPPDENHPYGHGKAEPIAAVVVVLGLTIAAAFIAIESIGNLTTRHHPPAWWTLIVLAGVIIIKETLSRYVSDVGESVESSAIQADAFHHRSDAITSAAAFIGISIALIGGEGYEIADDWAALFASASILYNAWHIGRPAIGELMDEQPAPEWLHDVEKIALSHPEVQSIEKVRLRKLGFDILMDFHLRVPADLSVEEGHRVCHEVKDELLDLHPYLRDILIHLEPE